jgi:secondary thiamine-phosphate synthase enzyme
MTLHRVQLERSSTGDTDLHDVTGDVAAAVAESGVRQGTVTVFTPGATAGVTTIEYESGCLNDLRRAFELIAPRDGEYEHNLRWGDGNGYSHVRAALMGPSLTVPVVDGAPLLGTWQQILVCDFDNRPRTRTIVVQVQGQIQGD